MAEPTVATRLERKILLVSGDTALEECLTSALPAQWTITRTDDPAALGGFAEVLQYRFMLLDLDDRMIDPLDIIDAVRRQLMLNIAIICFGGDNAQKNEARLARADRFFEREEIVSVMLKFCEQYDW